jgi:hypothetical protein
MYGGVGMCMAEAQDTNICAQRSLTPCDGQPTDLVCMLKTGTFYYP